MTGDPAAEAPASSLLLAGDGQQAPAARDCLVEVTVPVYNEEKILARNIRRLHSCLTGNLSFHFVITIADNASTDGTFALARQLSAELPGVRAVHLDRKGRGLALRHVWSRSDADIVAYMDADLSTGLDAFLPLIAPLLSGHSDLAIGTRLVHDAQVVRGLRREVISRAYNLLLRATLSARFSDAQCGFKAGRAEVIRALLPDVQDDAWFFDTELLMLAQRTGLRISEVPVAWAEDPDSKVEIVRTVLEDLRGVARLRFRRPDERLRVPSRPPLVQDEPDCEPGTKCRSAHSELTAPEQPR
jgi:glycosyltransferase involved in cell wall biosynthesis